MNSEKTKIEFDYGGTHYVLEYTAASLKKMERDGVKFAKLDEMIFGAPETIFRGAFYANHPSAYDDRKLVKRIFKELKRSADNMEPEYDEDGKESDALSDMLGQMLKEAVDELSGRSGNVPWKVTK